MEKGGARETTDENIKRRMRFARWISKATHYLSLSTSEYVILNAFPRQQWFRKRASVLRYSYIASPAYSSFMKTDVQVANKKST